MEITNFLLQRISEDETVAREALWENSPGYDPEDEYGNPWSTEHGEFAGRGGANFRHILRNHPARVLAECAAKRAIINNSADAQPGYLDDPHWNGFNDCHESALYSLAAVYASHPDYEPGWAI